MTSATDAPSDGERRNVSDAAGVVVLGACAVWSLITAAAHDGRPEGVLLAVLAVAAGYAAGRICGALMPVAAPCTAALAGLGLAVAAPHALPGPRIATPVGHLGAVAALLVLATGAACCAAWAARSPSLRLALRALAATVTVASAVLGSVAGFALCAGVLLCSLAAGHMPRRGVGLAGLALTAALMTGTAWAVAEKSLPDGLSDSLEGQLTGNRVQLWRDALMMAHRDPAAGVGPGRFSEFSEAASLSLPAEAKPHSAPLQQAAEEGVVGVLLLAAVFCWVLYTLWRTSRSTAVALTAGAALTALAALATVGNVLSFTTVTVGAGLLAGLATARPLGYETPDTATPRAREQREHL
ncbi:O-antigen ligase family protein [Streptomyces sp. ME02-8801-2C]|uniref:O-antigen ligase family protein n=1 Tax=Streptomyces sp. ME02-8801-2C TaxID=3028680 RepID=UPI0029B54863|nr:O-antigen ligase family protein [Streptomyces sp. ME02-8801-2C]MDX3452359.1 O-antigen ligase family protein [Streptomyces sp. ME02-8801-2C]